jgi:hypothetical protein
MESTTYGRHSLFSGKYYELEIPMAPEAFNEALNRWKGINGAKSNTLIQEAFPNLSPALREFIMTGCPNEEWQELFGENESEEPRPWSEE